MVLVWVLWWRLVMLSSWLRLYMVLGFWFLCYKALLAHSSVPGPRGGGVEAKASDGATQPEVAAVLVFSASWRYSSRLTGSAGLASKGLKKRAT